MMNKLSYKKNNNVKRFIIISPEEYEKYRRGLFIANPEALSSIEYDLIKIMQNNALNSIQKLNLYSNILTTRLNKSLAKTFQSRQEKTQLNDDLFPLNSVRKIDQQNQFGSPQKLKKDVESQVSPRKKEYFMPQIHSSMIEDETIDKDNLEQESLNVARTPNRFYGEEIYDKFPLITSTEKAKLDHRDYDREREKLYSKMRDIANVSDIRKLEFEDPIDKSFIKFKKRGSFTQYGFERNDISEDDDEEEILEQVNKTKAKTKPKTKTLSVVNKKKPSKKIITVEEQLASLVSPHKLRSGKYLLRDNKKDWIRYK